MASIFQRFGVGSVPKEAAIPGKLTRDYEVFKATFFTPGGAVVQPRNSFVKTLEPEDAFLYSELLAFRENVRTRIWNSAEFKNATQSMSDEDRMDRLETKTNIKLAELVEQWHKDEIKKTYGKAQTGRLAALIEQLKVRRESGASPESGEEPLKASDAPVSAVAESVASGLLPPVSAPPASGLKTGVLEEMSIAELLPHLAEGLAYDAFDSKRMRASLISRGITLNKLLVLLTAGIFVGNNPTRLTTKVRDEATGRMALGVANSFGVVRRKVDSSSVTLARISISFSPVVWELRRLLKVMGKLPASGVASVCPLEMQDVSLAGVRGMIPGGQQIEEFLLKFNRVLTKASDQAKKTVTKEDEADESAKKFMEVAVNGARADRLIWSWDFSMPPMDDRIEEFFSLAQREALGE